MVKHTPIRLFAAGFAAWAVLSGGSCRCKKDSGGPSGATGEYRLVWSDEFDSDGAPDPANWKFESGFVRNEEAQWYQPENAVCAGGLLVIEARRERVKNPSYSAGSGDWKTNREYAEYTSSSLLTGGLHSWKYGRFEMRARFDARAGLWPAFWTLGRMGDWPHCGEIDIMEYYNNGILANFAWGAAQKWQAVWDSSFKPLADFGDPEWQEKFHVWRMDWNDKVIRIFLDDMPLNALDVTQAVNRDGSDFNPFQQEHYIIVNLAIGGTAGGDPSNTQFPARYEIDYVRVYQK
ncbi:glycoside hydrolase family 16 protein [bacterium]|nr:glycoside hydrolase family 16 protein [bacterium]